jgi:hypothetical protein
MHSNPVLCRIYSGKCHGSGWHTLNGTAKAVANARDTGSTIFGQCFTAGIWTQEDTRELSMLPREDSNVVTQQEHKTKQGRNGSMKPELLKRRGV